MHDALTRRTFFSLFFVSFVTFVVGEPFFQWSHSLWRKKTRTEKREPNLWKASRFSIRVWHWIDRQSINMVGRYTTTPPFVICTIPD